MHNRTHCSTLSVGTLMKLILAFHLIVSSAVALAGCASTNTTSEPRSLDGTAWVLASLPGRSPVPGVTPTAQFESGRVAGSDGCNRFSLPFKAEGFTIEIGPMGPSTQMACPEDTAAQAAAFMSALQSARSFRTGGGTLELHDQSGAITATLASQAQSLAGTSWNVTMINNGRQAVVGIVDGSTVTMAFDNAGRVSGTTGCNQYNAAYTADGDTLRFSAVASTRMACADPAVDEQEQAFLRALEAVESLHFESDRLDLRGADGELAIILQRVR